MPNDNFDGLSPFEIIFHGLSPLLIAQERKNHENLVGEIGYIDRSKWLIATSQISQEIGKMQINNIQKSVLNYTPPEDKIKRGDIVIALTKVEPSFFRKNNQLDFTGPFFVEQIRDKNRLILKHILTGAKIKKSIKLVQKLKVDTETYKSFKNGLVNMRKGILSLEGNSEQIKNILESNAKNDEKLKSILDKNDQMLVNEPIILENENKNYNLRQKKKINYRE